MDLFSFKAEDKVLLVGEGNFTFSCELVRILKSKGVQDFKNFFPTCFEIEENSNISEENRLFLENEGVRVYYGVDATKLDGFHHGQFTKIVFNFPHVGGKMKINLNRKLLKDFFLSAANTQVLCRFGIVVMSLCAGQGGTDFEVKRRRWDDTWQVAEMAAHGDFALKKVADFPHDIFPMYISTGYRSQEKSFHTNGSLVHIFQKSHLPFPSELQSPNDLFTYKDIKLFFEHKNALDNNPFEKPNSPQSYLLSQIKEIVNLKIKDLPLYVPDCENRPPCFLNNTKLYLRKSLFEVLTSSDEMISFGLVFNEISSMEPVAFCELLIQTNDINKIENINKKFNIKMKKNSETCYSMNVDEVCSVIFNVDINQLWNGSCSGLKFIPNIVFPREYEFHVSFGSDLSFDEKKLCVILRRLPGGIISSVRQKSVYHPKDIPMTYYCYRITYISYKYPLYRSRVVNYHKNILCRVLEKFYKVNIR